MHLSVIIPAYNEENNLKKTIKEFEIYLSKQDFEYELIIVNDGSSDRTKEIAQDLAQNNKNIWVINLVQNYGKGVAVKTGLGQAIGKYRLFIDADNATSVDHLDKVWVEFEKGFDMVIGTRSYRDAPGAIQKTKQPIWKRAFGIIGNLLIQSISIRGIWDTQCGFKIFTEEAAEVIIPRLTTKRWMFDVEMLLIAKKHKIKIAKVPVVWHNSSQSRLNWKGYFVAFYEIIKIKLNDIRGKYKPNKPTNS